MSLLILTPTFDLIFDANHTFTGAGIQQIDAPLHSTLPTNELFTSNGDDISIQQSPQMMTRSVEFHADSTHQASSSPIFRMPHEMLGEIFVACLTASHQQEGIDSAFRIPALLMRICRHWKDVALSTPRLWTKFFIDIQRTKCISLRRWQAEDQLTRSGTCPIDIFIRFPDICGSQWEEREGPRHDKTNKLTESLFSALHRWRSLRLEGAAQITMFLDKLEPTKLAALEEIKLSLDGKFYSSLPADFLQAPNLKYLGLGRRLTVPTIFSAPWNRLTHLSFTVWDMPNSTPTQTLAETLALCHNLTSCFIRLYGWVYRTPDATESNSYPPIRLPNLSTLRIYEGKASNIHTSWDLPKLRDVEFHVTEIIPSHDSRASLRAIVDRTDGTIQTLTTQIDMHKQGDLVGCLDRCTDLRTLVLELPPPIHVGNQEGPGYLLSYPTEPDGLPHDDLLESLMPGHGPNNTTRCPNLETFRCEQKDVFSDRMLVDFVTSRWRTTSPDVSRLKCVKVNFGAQWKETKRLEIIGALSDLLAEGLILEFF